jgi:CRISPR/Cas system-associated exonuclease Cas4 (RecB family)
MVEIKEPNIEYAQTMSQYYNAKRVKNLFDPKSEEPFRVSRSKVDLFLNCPRCFYLDRRLGVAQPPGYPFSLNSAVDALLKKEFDIHRANKTSHPLMVQYGVDAVPLDHEKINEWRDALRLGIQYLHPPTNLLVTGGVDDVWVNPKGELIIVDYKATSKSGEVTLDAEWQIGYKRQMEMYQWLFRMNGFKVNPTGYFVYCNGDIDKEAFNGKLEFDIKLIPYEGQDLWIEPALEKIHECLVSDTLPRSGEDCDFCAYRAAAGSVESQSIKKQNSLNL